MTLGARAGAVGTLLVACGAVDDHVFTPLAIEQDPVLYVAESVGLVKVPVRLTGKHDGLVSAHFRAVADEAQNDCQTTDFDAAEGTIEWAEGQTEALVQVLVGEDNLAETDERFLLRIEPGVGLPAAVPVDLAIVIEDNDRTALIDAGAQGVSPGSSRDQAAELQGVLDEAAGFGRAVVVMPKGDYEISSVRLPAGVTLSARGVRWFRPPGSAADVVSLRVEHVGAENSAPSLVEGLFVDGRRDAQGPYRDKEKQDAHLVATLGDAERGGRIVATLESLELRSGTGSGVKLGSDSEITLCHLVASELWRDAITARGGATKIRIRGVDSTASEGTGLWLGPRELGFDGSLVMDAEVEDVLIGAGDVEVESTAGSQVTIRRLKMTRPPFRLDALDGIVRIADSVLMLGLSGEGHNHFGPTHDVLITGTTIVASEAPDDPNAPEAARTFAAVSIVPDAVAPSPQAMGPGSLVFDGCRFEVAGDVEADDVVYAVESGIADLSVSLENATLGSGFADWFAPECAGCAHEP